MARTVRTGGTRAKDNAGMTGPAGQATIEEAVRAFSAAADAVRLAEATAAHAAGSVSMMDPTRNAPAPSPARLEQARELIAEASGHLTSAKKVVDAGSRLVPSAELTDFRSRLDKTARRLEATSKALVTTLRERIELVARTEMTSRGIGHSRRRPPMPAVRDADGADLRPEPRKAHTAAEFVAALRQYREWAGDVPFRRMAQDAGNTVAPSTMCTALNGKILPRLEVVLAIVTGCGGTEEDRQRFATAWRTIRLSPNKITSSPSSPAVRALRSVSASG